MTTTKKDAIRVCVCVEACLQNREEQNSEAKQNKQTTLDATFQKQFAPHTLSFFFSVSFPSTFPSFSKPSEQERMRVNTAN